MIVSSRSLTSIPQSTGKQSFDESPTESYRALGEHTIDSIAGDWQDGALEEFTTHIEKTYLTGASARPEGEA